MYQRDFDLDHQFDPMLFICARTGKSEEAKIARHPNVAKPMGFLADLPFNQFSSNFPVYFDFLFWGGCQPIFEPPVQASMPKETQGEAQHLNMGRPTNTLRMHHDRSARYPAKNAKFAGGERR